MTARAQYEAGLRAGFQDESLGILEPVDGYPTDEPYLAGVRDGRSWWRRATSAAMVVDRPPLASCPDPEPLTQKTIEQIREQSRDWREAFRRDTDV